MLFSKEHLWVSQGNKYVRIGITDYAQEQLKAIMFLNIPDEGESVVAGERFGDVESIKTVHDLISPVSGKILKVNEDLVDEPDQINDDPYGSWFLEIEVSKYADDLMDEYAYMEYKDGLS